MAADKGKAEEVKIMGYSGTYLPNTPVTYSTLHDDTSKLAI